MNVYTNAADKLTQQFTASVKSPEWLHTGEDILNLEITELPTLLHPILPKVGVAALAGGSDLGKSYLLQQLTMAIVLGKKNCLGFDLHAEHRGVLYVSTEDDEMALSVRFHRMAPGLNPANLKKLKVITDSVDLVKRVGYVLEQHPTDLIVVDTFADVFEGDINSTTSVRSYIQQFKNLAHKHKCLVIFNHHCGKRVDDKPPHKDNLLGSQGFESSMRTVFEIRKDFTNQHLRHLCIVKANNLGAEFKTDSFIYSFDFENGFVPTGKRAAFETLSRKYTAPIVDPLVNTILEQRKQGHSVRAITKSLNDAGKQISKSKVHSLMKVPCPNVHTPKQRGQMDSETVHVYDEDSLENDLTGGSIEDAEEEAQ